jgi:hypothetical protein
MKLWCLIVLFLTSAVPAYSEAPSNSVQTSKSPVTGATISGQLMIGKTPMMNGLVFLYDKSVGPPPSFVKYWRIPDHTFPADRDGKFSFEVPGGTYYLQATQKDPNADMGPAKVEEFNYIYGDAEGNPLPLIVSSGAKLNLGLLYAFPVSPNLQQFDKGITALKGVVSDMEGKPVEGVMVFAYLSKDTSGRPVFVSTRTDIDGKYLLRVHDGGTFYLKVRSVMGGGAPKNGEFISAEEPVMITIIKEQKLNGVALKANKFSRGSKGTIE